MDENSIPVEELERLQAAYARAVAYAQEGRAGAGYLLLKSAQNGVPALMEFRVPELSAAWERALNLYQARYRSSPDPSDYNDPRG